MGKTLSEKIWDAHVVQRGANGTDLLYVDLHYLHEVTSPQAFSALRQAGRTVRRPELCVATEDHVVPTQPTPDGAVVSQARRQLDALADNCLRHGILHLRHDGPRGGVVHVIGPELGATLPGSTVVCGDSHTTTHGAFAALAFGVGTSEVEHVLATQTVRLPRPGTMSVRLHGTLPAAVSAKDVALTVIGRLGTEAAVGKVIEFRGPAVESLSMEGRMTLCNMAVEAGARAGIIAADDATVEYLRGRVLAPHDRDWDAALHVWRTLRTDPDAVFDLDVSFDVSAFVPCVTWGTRPSQVVGVDGRVPSPGSLPAAERADAQNALEVMGLAPGTFMRDVRVDVVFIGSCTNGRLDDLRSAASVLAGRRIAPHVRGLVVPGSTLVKSAAEDEGLHRVFIDAGFEWRSPGCSMCIAMNGDRLSPGQRSASTSNRNFEGRQGVGGRTHLVSPAVAAATAVAGVFASPSDLKVLSVSERSCA